MKPILRNRILLAVLATTPVVVAVVSGGTLARQAPQPSVNRVTEAQLDQWMEELSNWGRWAAMPRTSASFRAARTRGR